MTKSTPEPPYLLGLESSGPTCGVGLCAGESFLGAITLEAPHIHSRLLAPFCQRLLRDADLEPSRLSAIVVSLGPGSFTGLRIGFSLAKGLAHALNLPLIGVPTLEVWAFQLGEAYNPVLVVVDAHRGEVFAGLYRWESGRLILQGHLERLPIADLERLIQEPTWLTGPAASLVAHHPDLKLPEHLQRPLVQPPSVQMWALLQRGLARFNQQEFLDLDRSEPLYMRTFKGVS